MQKDVANNLNTLNDKFNIDNISWYLNLNINDIRNLFSDIIILPYEVDLYFCECGNKEVILKNVNTVLDEYVCEKCDNKTFLETSKYLNNHIWYESISTLLDEDYLISMKPTINFDYKNRILKGTISLNIPNSYDLVSDRTIYTIKELFELTLDKFGNINQLLYSNFDLEAQVTDKNKLIFEYISEDELININPLLTVFKKKILKGFKDYSKYSKSKVLNKTSTVKEFAFFFYNEHLLELDFYKWKNIDFLPKDKDLLILDALFYIMNERKEKSLRKSVIANYQMQIQNYDKYEFMYIYSITRHIRDINILNRMIDINLKCHISELIDTYDLFLFIQFLSTQFSDKQIEKLFLSYEKEEMFWFIDTISLFSEISLDLEKLVINKCKHNIIHSDIVNYHRIVLHEKLFKVKFDYQDIFVKACRKVESYDIRLPINGTELYEWSNHLQNCLSGYWKQIKEKNTVIFGFFIDNEIKFAVEIKNGKIVQSKSKYNKELQDREMSLVIGWFEVNFKRKDLIKKKKSEEI